MTARAGRTPFSARGMRGRGRRRPNWLPAAVYSAVVVVVLGGLFAWDQAYEARQRALLAPPPPPVLVRNLIEDIVGRGSVADVHVDEKAKTIDATIKDVLIKPGQSLPEQKKNLSAEGALAIQFVQARMRYKAMTVHIVKNGKPLATVAAAGQGAPKTEYAPDLK